MLPSAPFVDIHCHLLPNLDDGARDWDESLAMAKLAVSEGIETIVVTPHQCGTFKHIRGETIRARVQELQEFLQRQQVPLQILPGADVRIEPDLVAQLRAGEVLTLGDHRRHVLLELPHELYVPLEGLLDALQSAGIVGILSHPERNMGILREPRVLDSLVDAGCLLQVTAGSVMGSFGPQIERFSANLLQDGVVHFISTDAHGMTSRRPTLLKAFERTAALIGVEAAMDLFCHHPAAVAQGHEVPAGRREERKSTWGNWLKLRRAA